MNNKVDASIVCIGEILWDALPEGLFLGGAPLNVCLNLQELAEDVAIVSRVGTDRLGDEALLRLERTGLETSLIQRDENHETGFVQVQLNEQGDPRYEIIEPVAWDFIDLDVDNVRETLNQTWAIVFGSLAQRINTQLERLLKLDCLKVLDMNLRAPHYEKEHVLQLVKGADIVKMNIEELQMLRQWTHIEGDNRSSMKKIALRYKCSSVCVTGGGKGAMLWHKGQWFSHGGYPVKVADAVGAGDAFLAGFLWGLRSGRPADKLLHVANATGAFVASRAGANPAYSVQDIEQIMER